MGVGVIIKGIRFRPGTIPKYRFARFARMAETILFLKNAFAAIAVLTLLAACNTDIIDKSLMRYDGVVHRQPVIAEAGTGKTTRGCGASAKSPGSLSGTKPEASYRVGPGDDLRFNIFGEVGMTDLVARVDGEGFVQLPIIELINVNNKTTREIQSLLKEAYKENFVKPWITVELANAESHPLFFLGEFKKPGVHYLEHPRTLLEALALGGGLSPDAYLPGARLIRKNRMCVVDLHGLLKEGRFENNVYVTSKDMLFAPRKEDMQIYVLGAVVKPQAVPFGAKGRTVLEALTIAQGPVKGKALLEDVRIIRSFSAVDGELLIIDVEKMLTGKALDYPLEPGDVLYVPQTAFSDWNDAISIIMPSLEALGGILTPISLIRAL